MHVSIYMHARLKKKYITSVIDLSMNVRISRLIRTISLLTAINLTDFCRLQSGRR
jgi:hypothetical protein